MEPRGRPQLHRKGRPVRSGRAAIVLRNIIVVAAIVGGIVAVVLLVLAAQRVGRPLWRG